jgi:hypothetical protein
MKKDRRPRLSPDGLPIDATAWLREDWESLHRAIEAVKREVSARHKEPQEEAKKR